MIGVLLYNKESEAVYPNCKATDCEYNGSTVQTALNTHALAIAGLESMVDILNKNIQDYLQGKIRVEVRVRYGKSIYNVWGPDTLAEVNENGGFGQAFITPTEEFPYTWKETTFIVLDVENLPLYEVCAQYPQANLEIAYFSTSIAPDPQYAIGFDPEQEVAVLDDLDVVVYIDNELNTSEEIPALNNLKWSSIPSGVGSDRFFMYAISRKKVVKEGAQEAVWEYTDPNGRAVLYSVYRSTNDTPST